MYLASPDEAADPPGQVQEARLRARPRQPIFISTCLRGKHFSKMPVMITRINHAAVWLLVVVHQLIGWGWYAVWGEKWLNLHARTMTDIDRTHNVSAYVLAIATAIV